MGKGGADADDTPRKEKERSRNRDSAALVPTWLSLSLSGNTFMVIDGRLIASFSRHTYSMCGTSNRVVILATIPRVCGLAGPNIAATPSLSRSQAETSAIRRANGIKVARPRTIIRDLALFPIVSTFLERRDGGRRSIVKI